MQNVFASHEFVITLIVIIEFDYHSYSTYLASNIEGNGHRLDGDEAADAIQSSFTTQFYAQRLLLTILQKAKISETRCS